MPLFALVFKLAEQEHAADTQTWKLQVARGHYQCQTHPAGALRSTLTKNSWSSWPTAVTSTERCLPGRGMTHLTLIMPAVQLRHLNLPVSFGFTQAHRHTYAHLVNKKTTKESTTHRLNHTHMHYTPAYTQVHCQSRLTASPRQACVDRSLDGEAAAAMCPPWIWG